MALFAGDVPNAPQFGFPSGTPPTGYMGAPQPYPNLTPPTSFQPDPSMMSGAQSGAYGGIGQLGGYNQYGANLPWAQNLVGGMMSGPEAGFMQRGAYGAANMGMGAAQGAYGAGGQLYGGGGQILNTAFDPLNQQFQQYMQQTDQMSRANNAAAGLGTSPIGVSAEDAANNQALLGWQSNLLNRQATGLNAAGAAFGQGSGLQSGAANLFGQSTALPWQAQQTIGNQGLSNINALGAMGAGAAGQQQNMNQQYLQYLMSTGQLQQAANAANLGAYGAGLQGQGQAFNQAQQAMFADPNLQMQQYNQAQQQMFQDQLAAQQAQFNQQSSIFGGLGKLAGGFLGLGGLSGAKSLFGWT
jgi:hypothetical protein